MAAIKDAAKCEACWPQSPSAPVWRTCCLGESSAHQPNTTVLGTFIRPSNAGLVTGRPNPTNCTAAMRHEALIAAAI